MHLIDPERPTEHSIFNVPAGELVNSVIFIVLVPPSLKPMCARAASGTLTKLYLIACGFKNVTTPHSLTKFILKLDKLVDHLNHYLEYSALCFWCLS